MDWFTELWNWIRDIWDTGNYWLRVGIAIVVIWPIAMTLAALTPYLALKAIVALAPLLGIAAILLAVFDPLILAAFGVFASGRRVLISVVGVAAFELCLGAYLAAIPVSNDRGMIPLVLLWAVLLPFVLIGTAGRLRQVLVKLWVVGALVFTAIFLLGGREQASRRLEEYNRPSATASAARARTVGEETASWPDDETTIIVEPRQGTCIGVPLPMDVKAYRVDPQTDTPVWIKTWYGAKSKSAKRGEKGIYMPISHRGLIDQATFWVCNAQAKVTIQRD